LQYIYWQTREGHATVNPPNTPRSQVFMGALEDPNSFLAGRMLSRAGVDFVVVHTRLASPTFPPYQPAWPSDQLPRSAGRKNPWFAFYRSTSDAAIYRVKRVPSLAKLAKGAEVGYSRVWYPLEVDPSGQWRWMREKVGEIYVYASREYKHAELNLELTSFSEPRVVNMTLDGRSIARRKLSSTEITKVKIPLRLRQGLHTIAISANPGPVVVNDVLHNNDLRTISVRAGQLGIRLSSR
jgi:hypothetical protein